MNTIIGLVTKHESVNDKRTFISDEMKDAIFCNGGIAIGITPSNRTITLVNKKNELDVYNNLDNLFSKKEKDDMIA